MKNLITLTVLAFLLCGCASRLKREEATRVSTLASEHTLKRAHRLFSDSYNIEGVVVNVEKHPANILRSSMCYDVTYHIEYKQVLWADASTQPVTNAYVLPITEQCFDPVAQRLKIGDKVVVKGWIEKGR